MAINIITPNPVWINTHTNKITYFTELDMREHINYYIETYIEFNNNLNFDFSHSNFYSDFYIAFF